MTTLISRPSQAALQTEAWVRANAPPPALTARLAAEWEQFSGTLMDNPVFDDTTDAGIELLCKQPGVLRRVLLWQWAAARLRDSSFSLGE
jgi:hypothetical protein